MEILLPLLALLVFLWFAQMAGTYFQMRHYREVLGGITREGEEGYVGAGNAKARFGKGVVMIVVCGEDDVVKRVLRMHGISVFARFKEAPTLVDLPLDSLRADGGEGPYEKTTMLAAQRATEQIDRIKEEKKMETTAGQ